MATAAGRLEGAYLGGSMSMPPPAREGDGHYELWCGRPKSKTNQPERDDRNQAKERARVWMEELPDRRCGLAVLWQHVCRRAAPPKRNRG
jgi:hypothetical protein